jgi:hypothetical protein
MSRRVYAARITMTPTGMCRLRYPTVALLRSGASAAKGSARSDQRL